MKKNRRIIIGCSIIALCILAINIILTIIASLDLLCAILTTIFVVSLTSLLFYISNKETKQVNKTPLTSIENTIILKLEDLKSESIIPIRNEKEIDLIDDESIKKDLEQQRENKVTKEVIENELGKTIFINDLKEKMRIFEEEQEKIRQKEEEKELKELNKLIKAKRNK